MTVSFDKSIALRWGLALVFAASVAACSDSSETGGSGNSGGNGGNSADGGTGDNADASTGDDPFDLVFGEGNGDASTLTGVLISVMGSGGNGAITAGDVVNAADGTTPGDGFVTITQTEAGGVEIMCGTHVCECSDGIDNDGDGTFDGLDTECTGPFDDNEGSFATGIPGDNRDPKWQDCFFDGNSGAGDDGCRYHTDCITGAANAETDPNKCGVSDECLEYCEPVTPPGCDCFGCCNISQDGEQISIIVSDSCSLEEIDDEQKCPRCVQAIECVNECGECEICVGKTLADLPASCFQNPPPPGSGGNGAGGSSSSGGGPGSGGGTTSSGGSGSNPPPVNLCDNGRPTCTTTSECPVGSYCGFGCCQPYIR